MVSELVLLAQQHQVVQHLDDQQDRELGGSMVALNEALLPVGSQQDMIRLLGQRPAASAGRL